MELSFTNDQKLIREAAEEFLTKECQSDLVRDMEEDELGYPPDLWHKMAELGWLGLIIPDEYGGFGGNFMDLVVLLEVMGRHLVPVPFLPTVVLGGLSILYAGNDEQKEEFLPKIANGELILTMAIPYKEYGSCDSAVSDFQIVQKGNNYIINGTRLFTPYAHVSDYLVCPIQTKDNKGIDDGVHLFLIEGKSPGISYTVLNTTACDKQYEVVFNRVKVGEKDIFKNHDMRWGTVRKILKLATLAQCGLMIGGAEKVLQMTVAYAKKRVQFDRPIGSFQAIQHRCANMKVDLDGAKFAVYKAAWKVDEGSPGTLEISVAKAWVNQAYQRICAGGHQVIGGIGVMNEHDMQLYSRRAKAAELFLGDTNFHREIVANFL